MIFSTLHAGGKFESGNYKTAGGLHANNAVTILGWACPIPSGTSYRVSWSHIWNSVPTQPNTSDLVYGLGMVIALDNDADFGDTPPNNYYYLRQTANGQMALRRRNARARGFLAPSENVERSREAPPRNDRKARLAVPIRRSQSRTFRIFVAPCVAPRC